MSKIYITHSAHGHHETNNLFSYILWIIAITSVAVIMGIVENMGKLWGAIFGSDFINEDEQENKK